MTATEAMQELKDLGTAQNRKVYGRHGVGENMFGVSSANLKKLQKKIKVDHALAQALWASGNHDARILATMVADPAAMTKGQLDQWVKDLDNYVITDAFSVLAAKSPVARELMEKWSTSKGEWTGAAGWNILGQLALRDATLPDDCLEEHLATIEKQIHKSRNRVRYAMNGALIAIGMRNKKLEKAAVAAAKRIGKVEVDHGETGCKTPDAAAYIAKAANYKRAKRAG